MDKTLKEQLQFVIDNKTKPPGALGQLEAIALQAGQVQQNIRPVIRNPHIVIFAGDHGIAATGLVNPYPQEVTAQMVLNFMNGGAAINVFCRQHGIVLTIVDAGVNYDFNPDSSHTVPLQERQAKGQFINAKIGYGTRNYMEAPAMTMEELMQAMTEGERIVEEISLSGCNTIGFGEMGIGNTSSASLIMCAITGIPVEDCVGRGTGANESQLRLKTTTLKSVFDLYKHFLQNKKGPQLAHAVLSTMGGFEIVMMMGAYCKAAERRMLIMVDGFIATAALLCAKLVREDITDYCIYAHTSGEQGHQGMLKYLKAEPVLNLGMRLGEGTGAALAIPLVQSAVNFLNEMASFESAGVSEKEKAAGLITR